MTIPRKSRTYFFNAAAAAAVAVATLGASGCVADPEVTSAVFGLESGNAKPFRMGEIPDPVVEPGDNVIGQAANAPGACIWRRGTTNRRFQAPCPEGYSL